MTTKYDTVEVSVKRGDTLAQPFDITQNQLVTGSGDGRITWTGKDSSIKDIQIDLDASGTNSSTSVDVDDHLITVTVESSGDSPLATSAEVVAAVRGHTEASKLVSVTSAPGDGSGVVADEGPTNLTQPVDLSAYTITADVRKNPEDDPPVFANLAFTNDDKGNKFEVGRVVLNMTATQTGTMTQDYYFDIEATDDPTVLTLVKGRLVLDKDVTRS